MTEVQREAYDDAETVYSDPVGIIGRDNRNHRKKQRLITEATAAEPGDHILEVGCGSGLHTRLYESQYRTTAIDLSPSLVQSARRRCQSASIYQMDAMDPAFTDDSFAAVVGTAILHHLDRPRQALKAWQRVVKPGGSITLMEPNGLFPKDYIGSFLVPEEQNCRNMLPWRLADILDDATDGTATEWSVENCIFTPPWPQRWAPIYDTIDATAARVPGIKRTSQMLLIHIDV